jgi:hypothetical protein
MSTMSDAQPHVRSLTFPSSSDHNTVHVSTQLIHHSTILLLTKQTSAFQVPTLPSNPFKPNRIPHKVNTTTNTMPPHRIHASRNRSRRPVKDVTGSSRWYRRDDDLEGLNEAPSDEDESFYGPIPKQQLKSSGIMRNGYEIPPPMKKWYPFSSKDEYHHARLLLVDVEVYGADGSLERGPLRMRGIESYLGLMMAVGGGREFKAFRSARQLYALMKRTGFRFPEKELTEDEMSGEEETEDEMSGEEEETDYSEGEEEVLNSLNRIETNAAEIQEDSDEASEVEGTEAKGINWLGRILNEGNYLTDSDEEGSGESNEAERGPDGGQEHGQEDADANERIALDTSCDSGERGDDEDNADDESEISLPEEDDISEEE